MSKRFFLEFDKAGAEWVVVAYLANDGRMISVAESGKSPHLLTGCLISGAPEALVEKEHKLVGLHTDATVIAELRSHLPELREGYFLPRTMSIRQAGKKSNHGLNYFMQYRRFALETELDEKDAKKICSLYSEVAYPGLTVWWESVRNQLRKDRTLENCFGRKRRFLNQWGVELFQEAYAFVPQSTIVDMVNRGMVLMYRDESIENIELLAQVHDSLLTQCSFQSNISELALPIQKIVEYLSPSISYSGRDFLVRTDAKMGFSWGHMIPLVLSKDPDVLSHNLCETWEKLNESRKQEEAA